MSYCLVPYVVDLEQLRGAIGSKDEALIGAVMAGDPERFGDADPDDEEISLSEALKQLIRGETLDADSAHQYGYALQELCRHLGEEVPERDLWESIRWEVLEATGVDELLKQTGSPVPLPRKECFPAMGHQEAGDIAAVVKRLGDGHLVTAAPSGRKPRRSLRSRVVGMLLSRVTRREPMTAEEIQECLEEYEGWLRMAATKKKSLVFFYH